MNKLLLTTLSLSIASLGATAIAKTTPEEAAKLGTNILGPLGGDATGNAEGTIPPWTGGLKGIPDNVTYKVGDFHPDPFADDAILLTITPSNFAQHKDKLSIGQIAMFEKYQTFKMNVYKTRRTAAYPQEIYDAAKKNAVTAEIWVDPANPYMVGPNKATSRVSTPFPITTDAREMMLNHSYRWDGNGVTEHANQLVVAIDGSFVTSEIKTEFKFIWNNYEVSQDQVIKENLRLKGFQYALGPARIAGGVIAAQSPVNPTFTKAWSYNPGQRRVRRAPQIAFDNPGTGSDGLRFTDMLSGFGGSLERYNWAFKGKVEKYIPYNNYKLHAGDLKYKDIVQKAHINMDLPRYELHRVNVIDSTLRSGISHAFSRRTFYTHEDDWKVALVDCYDKRGELWRYQEEYPINYYEVPVVSNTAEVVYDLQAARYIMMGADNETGEPRDYTWTEDDAYFSPQSLKGRAKR